MTRLDFPERIDVGHGMEAHVSRFHGLGGRQVRVYRAGTNDLLRRFRSTGDREAGIANAKAAAATVGRL